MKLIEFEAVNFLANAEFRNKPDPPGSQIIFDNNLPRDGGISEAFGIAKDRFEQFKITHPDSNHPLIDFFKENPDQKANLDNLIAAYPAIGHLYKDEEKNIWRNAENIRYLSFTDITNLFVHEKSEKNSLNFRQGIRDYINKWSNDSEKKYEYKKFAEEFKDNKFYPEEAVTQFLLFMTEVFRGNIYDHVRYKKTRFSFSKADKFQSTIAKKRRNDITLGSDSSEKTELSQGGRTVKKKPAYSLLDTITPVDDENSIREKFGKLYNQVNNFGNQIEIIATIIREGKEDDENEVIQIGTRKIKVTARFELYKDEHELIRAVGTKYMLTRLVQKLKNEGATIFIIRINQQEEVSDLDSIVQLREKTDIEPEIVAEFEEKLREHEKKGNKSNGKLIESEEKKEVEREAEWQED